MIESTLGRIAEALERIAKAQEDTLIQWVESTRIIAERTATKTEEKLKVKKAKQEVIDVDPAAIPESVETVPAVIPETVPAVVQSVAETFAGKIGDIDIATLRAAFATYMKNNGKEKAVALVNTFGVTKLADLPEEKYVDAYNAAIKGA